MGFVVGEEVPGGRVGDLLGFTVGEEVGDVEEDDGALLGALLGLEVGASVCDPFGLDVGDFVGLLVSGVDILEGLAVGLFVGLFEGGGDGEAVGVDVSTVTSSLPNVPSSAVVP